jgi:transcriptional regulator GlxA family with amidase domain
MHVQILLFDGYLELDVFGALEVLRLARAAGVDARVELVRLQSATVTSANGLQLHVGKLLEAATAGPLLLIPGGGWVAGAEPGSWGRAQRARIGAAVEPLHAAGTRLGAIGTGSLFPGEVGILSGRRVALFPGGAEELRSLGADPIEAPVIDEGDLITAGGVNAGIELALRLMEAAAGAAAAEAIRLGMGYSVHPGAIEPGAPEEPGPR